MLVYTDASYCNETGEAVVSMLFLSNDMFMGMYTDKIQVQTSTEAELKGLVLAIEWIEVNYPDSKVIKIKTDNEANVRLYKRYIENPKLISPDMKYYNLWVRLCEYSKRYEIYVTHVNGHLADKNPNNVCDSLARRYLSIQRSSDG